MSAQRKVRVSLVVSREFASNLRAATRRARKEPGEFVEYWLNDTAAEIAGRRECPWGGLADFVCDGSVGYRRKADALAVVRSLVNERPKDWFIPWPSDIDGEPVWFVLKCGVFCRRGDAQKQAALFSGWLGGAWDVQRAPSDGADPGRPMWRVVSGAVAAGLSNGMKR